MLTTPGLAELLAMVASEPSTDAALDKLTAAVLGFTGSRNAMIARLDETQGVLVMRHGAGDEWTKKGVNVEIGLDLREGIVAYVAATGASIVSGNVAEDPRYRNLFDTTVSEIAVPIRDSSGRIRAVLNAESDQRNAYDANAVKACELIASLAAMIVEKDDSLVREEALIAVGGALDRAQTEEELLEQVIEVASDVLRFQASSIFLLDRDGERFVLRASVGRLKDRIGQIAYKKGEGCTGWVCEMGRPIRLDQPQNDPRWRGRFLEFPSEQIAAFLAVPIMLRGACIGAIRVIRKVSENEFLDTRFTDSDERVLTAIAEQLAIGLDSIRAIEKLVRSERMIAWGELSAKSSHMIGNRVFALKGDVNELNHLLSEAQLDRDALTELQKSLMTNVTRVEEILQDFRDFVTATQLERAPGDLTALVRETVGEVFPKRSAIELDMELQDGLPPVSMDSKRLRRAVSELIENSMNFMEKGKLSIRTGLAKADHLKSARLAEGKRFLFLEIADTGPGVDLERKEAIFQPFHSSRVRGMGLGLSIVKGIVDAHGGRIQETGSVGEGARFLILLPASERPKSEEA
jgi:signal transduction histidine kinase